MRSYQNIQQAIESELIESGRIRPGESMPTRAELIRTFGGSERSMMQAITDLEKKGLVTRLSPRKFIVAANKLSLKKEDAVGLIGFTGEIYADFEKEIIHRLYDRNIFSYSVDSVDNEQLAKRWYGRFFKDGFKSVLVKDSINMPIDQVEINFKQIQQLILVFNPFKQWNISHHGIYVDMAFPVYDALSKAYDVGCRRIELLTAQDPLGCIHARDRRSEGIIRFEKEYVQSNSNVTLNIVNYFDLHSHPKKAEKWAKNLDPETDAIIGVFDYAVVHAQEWLNRWGAIDYRQILYIGQGNTRWSNVGPNQFASYDFRVNDLVEMALELIMEIPQKTVVRRIKPKLLRENLLINH